MHSLDLHVDVDDLMSIEEHYAIMRCFHDKSWEEKRAWVKTQLKVDRSSSRAKVKLFIHELFDAPVGVPLFCAYHGIQYERWVYDQVSTGDKSGLPTADRAGQGSLDASTWIHQFTARIGENLPELADSKRKTVTLPVKNRARLFQLYRSGQFASVETYVCQATFYKILARTEFQHIQFPSAGKALYKTCNDCSMIEAKLQTTRDGLERARLKHQLASHLLLMMQERAFYSHSRMLASFTTSDHIFDAHTPSHMSIITDTMEQKKTQVPSQSEQTNR